MSVYSKQFPDGLKIHKDALQVIYGIEKEDGQPVEQPSLIQPKKVENNKEVKEKNEIEDTATMKVIEILKEQLNAERKNNETKDKIIMELQASLTQSQRLLDQQQKLSIADKQKILMLEEQVTQKKKRNFFNFFRRRDDE